MVNIVIIERLLSTSAFNLEAIALIPFFHLAIELYSEQ